MIIPKSFSLANRKWQVKIVDSKKYQKFLDKEYPGAVQEDTLGMSHRDTATLWINKDSHKTIEHLEHTYLHEFMHAMFTARGLQEHDEDYIDGVAALLHQYESTKRGAQ